MKGLENLDICKPAEFVERNTDAKTGPSESGRLILPPPPYFNPGAPPCPLF